jgi:4-hydroxyphenylpyruvate dioxygenase
MFYEDLYYYAKAFPGGPTPENQRRAARSIRSLCDQRGISVVCLQPFMHYEGLRDRQLHRQKLEELRLWIDLALALGTGIISIPSTCLSSDEVSGDVDLIVQDMREAADLARVHGISIAYESLAWGTHVDTWDQAWEVVRKVDRDNFGICLDTFNIAARVYADPTSPTRRNPDAERDMRASLDRMARTIDVRKILYVQVVDAECLAKPLLEDHQYYRADQHPRMSWSRHSRLFYGETERGAYLPIHDILDTILHRIGWQGWISAEMFNDSLADPDPSIPAQHARRAAESWRRIVNDMCLEQPLSSAVARAQL